MRMSLILLTANYPYQPGETFLEPELEAWGRSTSCEITILPVRRQGDLRDVPAGIAVDSLLTDGRGRLVPIISALFTKYFFKELRHLLKSEQLSWASALAALRATAFFLRLRSRLLRWLKRHGRVDVIYSYWNDSAAYAAAEMKREGWARKVLSRAHGFDVYEERWPHSYMPLKRQFARSFDRVFVLSEQARRYMIERYDFPPNCLEIRTLGVALPQDISQSSPPDSLHIVSVSSIVPVKRVDRIVEAIAIFARANSRVKVRWTHIGGGPQSRLVEESAARALLPLPNVQYDLQGPRDNSEVLAFYLSCPVDLFINASESEGMPVAIMEAMAAGIPAIAPNVGGVADLVQPECGYLLPRDPSPSEIAEALSMMLQRAKDPEVRAAARRIIATRYEASRVFSDFISTVTRMGNSAESELAQKR